MTNQGIVLRYSCGHEAGPMYSSQIGGCNKLNKMCPKNCICKVIHSCSSMHCTQDERRRVNPTTPEKMNCTNLALCTSKEFFPALRLWMHHHSQNIFPRKGIALVPCACNSR